MQPLNVILLLVLAAAVAWMFLENKRLKTTKDALRVSEAARSQKATESELLRSELKEATENFVRARDELAETKAKAKRKAALELAPESKNKASVPPVSSASSESGGAIGAIVRITDRELEDRHQEVVRRLKAEIDALKAELETQMVRVRDAASSAAQSAAAKAATAKDVDPVGNTTPADDALRSEIAALRDRLMSLELTSEQRERGLRKELDRARQDARSAEKRAAANHQLYQVAKGQMVVIEDRLAALRRKYEGALSPEQVLAAAQKSAPDAVPPTSDAAIPARIDDVQDSGGEEKDQAQSSDVESVGKIALMPAPLLT